MGAMNSLLVAFVAERVYGRRRFLAMYFIPGMIGQWAGFAWDGAGGGNSVAIAGLVATPDEDFPVPVLAALGLGPALATTGVAAQHWDAGGRLGAAGAVIVISFGLLAATTYWAALFVGMIALALGTVLLAISFLTGPARRLAAGVTLLIGAAMLANANSNILTSITAGVMLALAPGIAWMFARYVAKHDIQLRPVDRTTSAIRNWRMVTGR